MAGGRAVGQGALAGVVALVLLLVPQTLMLPAYADPIDRPAVWCRHERRAASISTADYRSLETRAFIWCSAPITRSRITVSYVSGTEHGRTIEACGFALDDPCTGYGFIWRHYCYEGCRSRWVVTFVTRVTLRTPVDDDQPRGCVVSGPLRDTVVCTRSVAVSPSRPVWRSLITTSMLPEPP